MKLFDNTNYVNNLPDKYAKGTDSNNYKLLLMERNSLIALENDIKAVDETLDIDKATGETLDLYGEMFKQPRGIATDEQYRIMIRAKIARNICDGSINSVLQAIRQTFSCDVSEISIVNSNEPCTVKIEKFPLSVVTKAGFTTGQAVQIIKSILPVGIQIEFNFEGTFELCSSENEMGVDGLSKGLIDTEQYMDSTLYPDANGGYLGEFFSGAENLPI